MTAIPISAPRSNFRPAVARAAVRAGVRPVAGPSRVRPVSRPSAAVYWRRRVAAVALGLGLVAIGSEAASAVVSGVSRTSGPASIHYVVQSGDTLWSIARKVAPHDDPRAVADLLLEAHGSSVIRPGDVIDWAG